MEGIHSILSYDSTWTSLNSGYPCKLKFLNNIKLRLQKKTKTPSPNPQNLSLEEEDNWPLVLRAIIKAFAMAMHSEWIKRMINKGL